MEEKKVNEMMKELNQKKAQGFSGGSGIWADKKKVKKFFE